MQNQDDGCVGHDQAALHGGWRSWLGLFLSLCDWWIISKEASNRVAKGRSNNLF